MNIMVLILDWKIFLGVIFLVKVFGMDGEFQVLKNYVLIVFFLDVGYIIIIIESGEYCFFNEEIGVLEMVSEVGCKICYVIKGGFVEVLNNEVFLFVIGLS